MATNYRSQPCIRPKQLIIILLLWLTAVVSAPLPAAAEPFSQSAQWELYFSPKGGATKAVVNTLNQARQSILVQAYSFTSAPIAKALVQAHKRGVKVEVILDKSQRSKKCSSADFLVNAGIPTYIDAAHAIAHNKVMIIDDQTVITGSFNFTRAAEERNAENLLIIQDTRLALRYLENWRQHAEHSEKYVGKQVPGRQPVGESDGMLDRMMNFLEKELGGTQR
ncbi:MAG TPA: phospholipase D family protein [Desulfobacterales bacterium]|nr:phospholipase D family protein [Desulfobacterales bacterium]